MGIHYTCTFCLWQNVVVDNQCALFSHLTCNSFIHNFEYRMYRYQYFIPVIYIDLSPHCVDNVL